MGRPMLIAKRHPLNRSQPAVDEPQTKIYTESIVTETLLVTQEVRNGTSVHGEEVADYVRNRADNLLAIEHNETFNLSAMAISQEVTANRVDNGEHNTIKTQYMLATSTPLKGNAGSSRLVATSSTQPSGQKSPCTPRNKCKSYDPVKARIFIKRQQIKRKEELAKQADAQVDKEEIKKRLMNLQKNSLKIVEKNVKRARTKTNDSIPFEQKDGVESPSKVVKVKGW